MLVGLGTATPICAVGQSDGRSHPSSRRTRLQLFGQVLNQIRVNLGLDRGARALPRGGRAMVHAADHSYVVYVQLMRRRRSARREAVSARSTSPSSAARPYGERRRGTAARRLDILPGDELVAVDELIRGTQRGRTGPRLAGPKKTPVRLTIERRRDDGSFVTRSRRAAGGGGGDGRSRVDDAEPDHGLRSRDDVRRRARRRRSPPSSSGLEKAEWAVRRPSRQRRRECGGGRPRHRDPATRQSCTRRKAASPRSPTPIV